jgi:hypothetical protein
MSHYINSNDLWKEMKLCKEKNELTSKAVNMLMLLAKNFSDTNSYKFEQDKEDCIAMGIHDCAMYWRNFMPFNKKLILDLIELELWMLDEYEFLSKEEKAKKSMAPERCLYNDGTNSRWVKRFDVNDGKVVRYLYSPTCDYLIDRTYEFSNVEYLKPAHEEAEGAFFVTATDNLSNMDGFKSDGYYILSVRQEMHYTSSHTYWHDGVSVVETPNDLIELDSVQVYKNLVWSKNQVSIREQLYRFEDIRKVNLVDGVSLEVDKLFQEIKRHYSANYKSNAFAYFTQQVKNGMKKQWDELNKKLPYSLKVSLDVEDDEGGLFNI